MFNLSLFRQVGAALIFFPLTIIAHAEVVVTSKINRCAVAITKTHTSGYSGWPSATTVTVNAQMNTQLARSTDINFRVNVGGEESLFFRGGDDGLTTVQARAVSGPRSLLGQYSPAGNAGGIIAFQSSKFTKLHIGESIHAVRNGVDRGLTVQVTASELERENGVAILKINPKAPVLGSARNVRDFTVADRGTWVEYDMRYPGVDEHVEFTPEGDLFFYRESLSGKARYTMRLRPLNGARVERLADGSWCLVGNSSDKIDFEFTVTNSEPARPPIDIARLVKPWYLAKMTAEQRQRFMFLFYMDGALAGAHAYMTPFTRDLNVIAMIASNALTEECLWILARSGLDMSMPNGNLAHEPELADKAAQTRMLRAGGDASQRWDDSTILDDSMIDTRYLVLPVIEQMIAQIGAEAVYKKYLSLTSAPQGGKTYAALLKKNMEFVFESTSKFAADPTNYKNLLRILRGRPTGQWRDSEFGLFNGVYPFETNCALAPAALRAMATIYRSNIPGLSSEKAALQAEKFHAVWSTKPFDFFVVKIANQKANDMASAYSRTIGLDPLTYDPYGGKDLEFFGIALNDDGSPVAVMHSDVAFVLLYTHPPLSRC